jgi:hypothetical protein
MPMAVCLRAKSVQIWYQKQPAVIAMNFIALGLAEAPGYDYVGFRSDFASVKVSARLGSRHELRENGSQP